MHLIDLDVAAFDIFDLPPLNEYELYIKNFGRSDTKQVIGAFVLQEVLFFNVNSRLGQ